MSPTRLPVNYLSQLYPSSEHTYIEHRFWQPRSTSQPPISDFELYTRSRNDNSITNPLVILETRPTGSYHHLPSSGDNYHTTTTPHRKRPRDQSETPDDPSLITPHHNHRTPQPQIHSHDSSHNQKHNHGGDVERSSKRMRHITTECLRKYMNDNDHSMDEVQDGGENGEEDDENESSDGGQYEEQTPRDFQIPELHASNGLDVPNVTISPASPMDFLSQPPHPHYHPHQFRALDIDTTSNPIHSIHQTPITRPGRRSTGAQIPTYWLRDTRGDHAPTPPPPRATSLDNIIHHNDNSTQEETRSYREPAFFGPMLGLGLLNVQYFDSQGEKREYQRLYSTPREDLGRDGSVWSECPLGAAQGERAWAGRIPTKMEVWQAREAQAQAQLAAQQ